MAPDEQNGPRVRFEGYQYLCDWGATERMYSVTIYVAKTATSSDFLGTQQAVPGCGQKVSVFFQSFRATGNSECATNQVNLILWLNRDGRSAGSVRAALLTLDDQPLEAWDLNLSDTGSYYQWLKS